MSADERRESVLNAAMIEFGLCGYVGTSTQAIADRVGVSQPYLFRLFESKKAIFIATCSRCFDRLIATFTEAAKGRTGDDALSAMGVVYKGMLNDREILQMQLQMWAAACYDEEIREVTRAQMNRFWQVVQDLTGADEQQIMQFTAAGMLLNVMSAMDMPRVQAHLGKLLTP